MPKKESNVKKSSQGNYRFLVNANISRIIIPKLSLLSGFDFKHISQISSSDLPDTEVVEIAKKEKRVIITHDLDYGEIYYLKEQGNIGVIMLRLKDQTSTNVTARLREFFRASRYKKINLRNSLAIISDDKIRIFSP